MATSDAYDLVVIGSGPAGESGAVTAAALKKRVVVVEKSPYLGGSSANTGTLPSKTLRETAVAFAGLRSAQAYGVDLSLKREATIAELMYHERHVKQHERERIHRNLADNAIDLVRGSARFVDPHTLVVTPSEGSGAVGPEPRELTLRGEVVLIASGS